MAAMPDPHPWIGSDNNPTPPGRVGHDDAASAHPDRRSTAGPCSWPGTTTSPGRARLGLACHRGAGSQCLGYEGQQIDDGDAPQICWCTTGPATVLPLHAAGEHASSGKAVSDRVISSYTPTLGTLIRARARPAPPRPKVLIVGVPDAPTPHPSLASLTKLTPSPPFCRSLSRERSC